jgi:hypothetical protein
MIGLNWDGEVDEMVEDRPGDLGLCHLSYVWTRLRTP